MDKDKIAKLARQMGTKEDLLALLNFMKLDDMRYVDKYYPFTMQHLLYYCNPNHVIHRYNGFKIKKKSGGFRQITAPRNRSFKLMLSYVNEIFKAVYTPSEYAMGFVEHRSVVDNASKHKGMNYVFNIDIKDFFPSIEQPRVWKRLQLHPLNFPRPVANVLAGLCSMRGKKDETGKYKYVLPQGAPTSPILTNMICDTLDRRLAGLAKRFGLNYSRYADDITFSSMHNVYHEDGDFRKELRRIIEGQGFSINETKTRLQKIGSRQEVTGLIVNDKPNVSRKYIRDIRNILYIWDRYGYIVAYGRFYPKYKQEKGHVKRGNPDLVNVIDGKLMYLKMVRGEDDSVYQRLSTKFKKLVEMLSVPNKTTEYGITYIETMPVVEFEKRSHTELVITSSFDRFHETATESGDGEWEGDNLTSHRFAYFCIEGKKLLASVNLSLKEKEEKQKEMLSISRCRNAKGQFFWLVHKSNKRIVPPASTSLYGNERMNHIEKYLGLDYDVGTIVPVIDYSYVKMEDVRHQLNSNNREMMRFRYGTRYHEIDFDEFCVFAHLQAEMLLNYYYNVVNNSDISLIKEHIRCYNPTARLDNANTLSSIPFSVKLWAFNIAYKVDWKLFDNLRRVWNKSIHQLPDKGGFEIEQYQRKLEEMGFAINAKGLPRINWKDKDADEELKILYNKIKRSKDFEQYEHLLWYHSMPFDEIISGLKDLSSMISSIVE